MDSGDDDWLPVPVAGRPSGSFSGESVSIPPLVFNRRPRTKAGLWAERFRRRRIPGMILDRIGVHLPGVRLEWDNIVDVTEPSQWHHQPREGFKEGSGKVGRRASTASGHAIAITMKPPMPTVLLFELDFADPLPHIRSVLLDLLSNPHARPTLDAPEPPPTFAYLRTMDG